MPIIVLCSHCQSKAQVGEQFAGKLVKCPKCGQVFTATPPAPVAQVVAPPVPPLPPDVVQGELLTPEEEARLRAASVRERPAPERPRRDQDEPARRDEDRPRRYPDDRDDWDDRDRDDADDMAEIVRDAPPFPKTVTVAGIAWIVFGALILLGGIFFLIGLTTTKRVDPAATGFIGVLATGLFILFGGVFIHVGEQSITGKARDTLGNGIGSIIFGVLNLLAGIGGAGSGQIPQAIVNFICGAGLLAAGTLVLIDRGGYVRWRRANRPERRRRR